MYSFVGLILGFFSLWIINFIHKITAPRKKEDQDSTVSAAERARNLFSVLDSDGNGVLDMDEFIAGRFEVYQTS